ncbi:MAG: DUF1674 domain-containing protein [Alphaproteobacteria bacterium]|nr:DUF1674 domain-containing protein [Alphaproteobacteria bacterium]
MAKTDKQTDPKAKRRVPAPGPAPARDPGKARAPAAKPARKRPDPTRYGDWEKNGRCIDF